MKVSKDTLIIVLILFVLSAGGNIFQQIQISHLFQDNVDARWQQQNLEFDLAVARKRAAVCEGTGVSAPP